MIVFAGVDMCANWIGALLLIVVGFVSVRAAHKGAGLMVGGGGVLLLVTGCCAYWGNFAAQSGVYSPALFDLVPISAALGFLCRLAAFVLVIVGAALVAKEMKTPGGANP